MPRLPSLDTRTVLRSEPLSDNPVIKDHDGFKLFKPSMQGFIDLIREKK